MGRMNDIEKKKTLFQVISRIRDIYLKLQVIQEWTKISNEHLALKFIKESAKTIKGNLSKLIGGLYYSSNNLSTKKHIEPNFRILKDLLVSSERVPAYFAPSIEALSPVKQKELTEIEKSSWISTLESILRYEIAKNMINIPRNDVCLIEIKDGKARILFLNLFEFEFTLVPEASGSSAWFVLGVQVDFMKEVFKNSLTGIFQHKYNNISTSSDAEYFKNILTDCSKYIELFYYEKLFSQFSFLSNFHGKSICSFQKSPQGDYFKISPWFMINESITISFHHNNCSFKIDGIKDFEILPTLSFDENEAQNIFEQLFTNVFMSKLETFLNDLKTKNYILDCSTGKFSADVVLFEGFKISITINPFSKKFKFVFINYSEFLDFDHLESGLEEALSEFDYEKFLGNSIEILKEIYVKSIAKHHPELSIVSCAEISNKTGICLQLREIPSSAFSINLNSRTNNALMEIKFQSIVSDFAIAPIKIPKIHSDLSELITNQKNHLLSASSRYSFESITKSCEINGEFESEDQMTTGSYRLFTYGLPNCITKVSLRPENINVIGRIDFTKNSGLNISSLEFGPVNQNNLRSLMKVLKNYICLLTIWEQFNLLQETSEIEIKSLSCTSIKLLHQNTSFEINEHGDIIVITKEQRLYELEKFIQSDSFSIYDFIDKLLEIHPNSESAKKDSETSTDLTWLSDSFM